MDLTKKAISNGPVSNERVVTCLGRTFVNDVDRRAYFTEKLRKKLQDAKFRGIEGFPIASDEEFLTLSDPPYYTACPNPWIENFIAEWEVQRQKQPKGYRYHREPFATDVSEGKNDPLYKAHSYHTKVPHKAIMRYILHYTEPGDIVLDSFCGTGMTGVAAQMCGDREVVMTLGYQVKPDGTILQKDVDKGGKTSWKPFSKLGIRRTVQNDLSPIATFIAYNYTTPVDKLAFLLEAQQILKEVEKEFGWMYKTVHTDGKSEGQVNYTVWSDVFICDQCGNEVIYWDAAIDKEKAEVRDPFECTSCTFEIEKRTAAKAYESHFDPTISEIVNIVKQVPVLINYSLEGKRYEKYPDEYDKELITKINRSEFAYQFPTAKIENGAKTKEPIAFGATYTHLMYTKRNLSILAGVYSKIRRVGDKRLQNYLKVWFTSSQTRLHRMNRYAAQHQRHVGPLANTLYISSTPTEISPFYFLNLKIKENSLSLNYDEPTLIQTSDAAGVDIPSNSLDYIFLDPPFGHNIMYSDLNIIWESWIGIRTNSIPEAIENKHQHKNLDDYRKLMFLAFKKAFDALKPGRWMTVEFSNTKAAVWNSIQTALTDAGFIVASVTALNKGRGGLHAIIGPTAVKQDLVISAYKPTDGFEERFKNETQIERSVWDFVRTHLKFLPVTKRQGSLFQFINERDPRFLFDQIVAFYVRRGFPVPISSGDFRIGLAQRFSERDGMYFLPDQVAQYDRNKMVAGELAQMFIFVSDEASAIQWLRQLIKEKPQTFSDINPQFMQQLGSWSKNETHLDLRELLNQNFLCYDGKGRVPEQIHAYLSSNWKQLRNRAKDDPVLVTKARDRWYVPHPNKTSDLEKLREKTLIREFEEYKVVNKKLKVFRLEAVRAGFKRAWQERDYAVIVAVADNIPNNVLEEDPKLVMWYDQAVTRVGGR